MSNEKKYEFEESNIVELPNGGTVTVTVSSSGPINRDDYMILKSPTAAIEMGYCMANLANAFRPPDTKEIEL